ncbi:MAG: anti-sigma factor antagonist [Herpetosiphon sp.]
MTEQSILEVPAKLDSLLTINSFVVDAAHRAGLDEHAVWEVQLAVDEAATNVIQHAYPALPSPGRMWVEVDQRDDTLRVTLRDQGSPFDPVAVPEPDLNSPLEQRKTGGLGLFLMRRLMDDVVFYRENGQNMLVMEKRLPPQGLRFVELNGRIDASVAPRVQELIRDAMQSGGQRIVMDLSQVSFLSSSGLRALLLMARELRRANGDLRLCALQPQVAEVFHLTGFDQIFPLYISRDDAAALQRT